MNYMVSVLVSRPAKSPLKVQNGVQEADSPIKKVAKRSRQLLDSDDDEAPVVKEQVVAKGQGDKEAVGKTEKVKGTKDDVFKAVPTPLSPPPAPATPVTPATPATPASSASPGTPSTPNSISPSGIAKRKTGQYLVRFDLFFFPLFCFTHCSIVSGTVTAVTVIGLTKIALFLVVFFLSESTSSQTEYNPSRPNYHPVDHPTLLCISSTYGSQLRNIETLSNLFRSVLLLSPDDLLCCVYLCLNQLGPAHLGMELGVGETVLMKAVAQATGRQLDKIKAEAQEKGDLGLVAESSRSNQRMMFQPASLTAGGVFRKLKEIASMSGNSAMNKKIDIIKGLFVACRFSEARYIVRSLAGKLRIGLAEQSVLSALSQAVCLTPPGQVFPPAVIDAGKGMSAESRRAWIEEKSLILKQTYCEMPNYDVIIPVLLKEGIDQLPNHCKLTPGVPLRPMLAHPTKGVGEVMKKFDEATFTCEYKYDGERAQIHILESGEVRIFSRNQEDNTTKYPDIISRIPKVKKDSVVSCVLDSEAVAWDREKKQIQPFQVLTTRKRKDVDASEIKVQVCVYAFDLLYLNGESLVRQPLCRRRALLKESFSEVEGEFVFARSIDSDNTDTIAEFLEQSVRDSCEGLMVKTLEKDATYEIAKRSHNWLKLKKDYLDGVGDTVDLCVIGAYMGKGKRTGTYGGFLLACYDEDNEEFQSVCKIGTGFKDEDLEQHYKFLKEHILQKPRAYYRFDQSAEPDVWLDAVQVWEVKCADLSLSPVYHAAMGMADPEKGISLRFPRFLRIRDDKKPEDATTGAQIADLYKKQQQIQNQGEKADPEDYY
uniref:DNA ligase n=1 Tax=Dicentrarchus labrax TaxID=13489 RepID=A0A8C4EKG2_DICLA